MDSSLLLSALMFGALTVAGLSYLDFHAPFRVSEIRYAALRERYYLAIAMYVTVALILFGVVFYGVSLAILFAIGEPAKRVNSVFFSAKADATALGLSLTIFVLLLARATPGIKDLIGALRQMMQQTFARFPMSAETVSALIARSPFAANSRGRAEVVRELDHYCVPSYLIERALNNDNKVLSSAAADRLQELCSLHLCLADLRQDNRFRRYFIARQSVVRELEKSYHACLRRVARAILLAIDIPMSEQSAADLTLEISDCVAEECDAVRERYHRLLAEMVVSCLPNRDARTKFIQNIGYDVHRLRGLPFFPLVAVFVLDFAISIVPAVIGTFPASSTLALLDATILGLAHAVAFTMAVFWSIYPKTLTNFARPSLRSYPWKSYLLFGGLSYLVGIVALYTGFMICKVPPAFVASQYPLTASILFASLFFVITVALSFLLDARLRSPCVCYRSGRIRDGLSLALVMALSISVMQLGIIAIAIGLERPSPDFGITARAIFTGLFSALGVCSWLLGSLDC